MRFSAVAPIRPSARYYFRCLFDVDVDANFLPRSFRVRLTCLRIPSRMRTSRSSIHILFLLNPLWWIHMYIICNIGLTYYANMYVLSCINIVGYRERALAVRRHAQWIGCIMITPVNKYCRSRISPAIRSIILIKMVLSDFVQCFS